MSDEAGPAGRPAGDAFTELDLSVELHRLMVFWRERLDPMTFPWLIVEGAPVRGKVGQDTIAMLAGKSTRWYARLEAGDRRPNYGDDYLNRVAYALRLKPDEKASLFRLATGRPPPAADQPVTTKVTAGMRYAVQQLRWPAWYSDRAWDVLYLNEAAAAWFPHMAYEPNVMRWAFHYPESQRQLVHWKQVWAPRMLAQMRAQASRYPDDERLARVLREAIADCVYARQLFEHPRDQPVVEHPDGDRRWLHVPFQPEPVYVEITASTPMGAPDLRRIELLLVADIEAAADG